MNLTKLWSRLASTFLIVIVLALNLNAATNESQRLGRTKPPPEIRLIQYSFTLKNTSSDLLPFVEFWCHAPLPQSQIYSLLDLDVSDEFTYTHDHAGNRSLYIQLNDLPPFASKIITIKATLRLCNEPQSLGESDITQYLEGESFIESNHPKIVKLAKKLEQTGQVSSVKAILNWITSNIREAGYLKNTRGALYALEHKKGDCTEFAALFIALCRANRIPARLMGGYITSSNAILHPREYHNWAEFYLNGRWQIADPQRGVFMPDQEKYIAMQVIDTSYFDVNATAFNRFRYTGKGLKVKMN